MITTEPLPTSTDYTHDGIVHTYPDGRVARMTWEGVVVVDDTPARAASEPKGEEAKS